MKNSLIKQSFLYFALGLVFVYFVVVRVADYGYDVLACILIIMTLMDFGIGIGLIITGLKRRKKNLYKVSVAYLLQVFLFCFRWIIFQEID